jgi:simple sugar transport system permease protein
MMPTLIFLTIPLVFLVASGEIDLSFASTYAVAAYVFALLVKNGVDPAICFVLGILTGAAIGALVGMLIVVFRLSSLVASLGMLFLLRGVILLLTNSRSITIMEVENHWIYPLLVGNFYGFPMQIFWAALFVIFCYYFLINMFLESTFNTLGIIQ